MTHCIEPGVVAAALLAHEFEQFVGQGRVNGRAHSEVLGIRFPNLNKISPRFLQRREVDLSVIIVSSPTSGNRLYRAGENGLICLCVDDVEFQRQGTMRSSNRNLQVCRSIANLIEANYDLRIRVCRSLSRTSAKKET